MCLFMPYLGEIAAVLTAVSWAATAIIFTGASHRIGSFTMSHFRMLFCIVFLVAVHAIVLGSPVPLNMSPSNWLLLGISGLLGFFAGDAMLYQSYVDISPRVGSLITNTYPIFSALLAMFVLGEILSVTEWLGIFVTLTGVVWVILEKNTADRIVSRKHFTRGLVFALGYSLAQAASFLCAKPAMTGEHCTDPLSATLVRAIFGGAAYWIVSTFSGRLKDRSAKIFDIKTMKTIAGGVVIGTTGVWLSMYAIKTIPIGIATTLIALVPVAVIPMSAIAYKERISWRAVIGAVVAVLGIAILFNSKT